MIVPFNLCRKKPLDIFVVVGEHNVNATSHVRKSHLVEKFIVHENLDSPNNDIALIKVTSTIDFNVNVAQICVPKTNDLYVHRKSIVSGWGELAFGRDLHNNCSVFLDLSGYLISCKMSMQWRSNDEGFLHKSRYRTMEES